jgi:hypothetical protein
VAFTNPYWQQATWFIDPQNSSANASDGNTGLDAAHPLLTFAELAARWGTKSPVLRQNTTITFLSSHTDNTDPVDIQPICAAGAVVSLQGTLGAAQQVAAVVLAGVVAKNRATPQLLTATLAAGLSAGMLAVNTTAGKASRCWLKTNTAGNNWTLTQPLAPVAIPVTTPTPAEVDTWANGDTVTIYQPVAVNIVRCGPLTTDFNAGFTNAFTIYQLQVFTAAPGSGPLSFIGSGLFNVAECTILRIIEMSAAGRALSGAFVNCDFANAAHIEGSATQQTVIAGGQFRSGTVLLANVAVQRDVYFGASFNGIFGPNAAYREIYVDTGKTLTMEGAGAMAFLTGPFVWGPGTLNVTGRVRMTYPSGAGNAVATFLLATIQMNGVATAFSFNSGAGVTWNGGIATTAANLDAAQGAAGFGGNAVVPGGATLTNLAA